MRQDEVMLCKKPTRRRGIVKVGETAEDVRPASPGERGLGKIVSEGPEKAGQRGVGSGCGFPAERVKFWKLSYWCQGETLASHCSASLCTQGEGGSLESGLGEWARRAADTGVD